MYNRVGCWLSAFIQTKKSQYMNFQERDVWVALKLILSWSFLPLMYALNVPPLFRLWAFLHNYYVRMTRIFYFSQTCLTTKWLQHYLNIALDFGLVVSTGLHIPESEKLACHEFMLINLFFIKTAITALARSCLSRHKTRYKICCPWQ